MHVIPTQAVWWHENRKSAPLNAKHFDVVNDIGDLIL